MSCPASSPTGSAEVSRRLLEGANRAPPPEDLDALLARAQLLAGQPLAEIAAAQRARVPDDLRRAKGWIGELLELALGADGGTRPEPDFSHLGVELKSVPVDAAGVPIESTWVCNAPTDDTAGAWEGSLVQRKLACVLWVPVVTGREVPPGDRWVGEPRLWRPTPAQEATLRADWEELTDLLALGEAWRLDARWGRALQVRPKAANAGEMAWTLDHEGEWVRRNPRGFYLRRRFTREVLA